MQVNPQAVLVLGLYTPTPSHHCIVFTLGRSDPRSGSLSPTPSLYKTSKTKRYPEINSESKKQKKRQTTIKKKKNKRLAVALRADRLAREAERVRSQQG